jgi:hypothetical protein
MTSEHSGTESGDFVKDIVTQLIDEITPAANDSVTRAKLGALTASVFRFCTEAETFPVFREWYAREYDEQDPEAARKIRSLSPKAISQLSLSALACIDTIKVSEIFFEAINRVMLGVDDDLRFYRGVPLQ